LGLFDKIFVRARYWFYILVLWWI